MKKRTAMRRMRNNVAPKYIAGWLVVLLMALLLFSLTSCRNPKEIIREVPVHIHDTMYQKEVLHDSVCIENTVKEYVKGDTVYKEKTQIKYVERTKTDTAISTVEVPVEITTTVVKEVEKPLSWWQKTLIWLGVGFVVVLSGSAIAFYYFLKNAKRG